MEASVAAAERVIGGQWDPDAVVAHLDAQRAVARRARSPPPASPAVLDHVGERLGHDEVRGRLELRRRAGAGHVDLDGHVDARDERVDAGAQAAAGQRRGQDPVGELAQLVLALLALLERLGDQRLRLARVLRDPAARA